MQVRPGWLTGTAATGWLPRLLTAAALVIGAVVHLRDAPLYDANAGALLSQGQLFRVQAGVAIAVALLVLVWPRWPAWGLSIVVAGSAVAAVVTYTYLDIGPFAGLPGMFEPSWGRPESCSPRCRRRRGAAVAGRPRLGAGAPPPAAGDRRRSLTVQKGK